jgi:hypothetical protein
VSIRGGFDQVGDLFVVMSDRVAEEVRVGGFEG